MNKRIFTIMLLAVLCPILLPAQINTINGQTSDPVLSEGQQNIMVLNQKPVQPLYQAPLTYSFTPEDIDYAKKARTQTALGWTFVAGGTALLIAGIAQAGKEQEDIVDALFVRPLAVVALMGAGITVGACSIPFFIAAKKNKEKARASAAIMLQPSVAAGGTGIRRIQQPAIGVQWRF